MKAKYLLKVNDKDTWICTFAVDSLGWDYNNAPNLLWLQEKLTWNEDL